jgi:hypothetical protein
MQARLQRRDLLLQVLGLARRVARASRPADGAGGRPADDECADDRKRP